MNYTRIISLVPSLTELIIDLGLKEQLVGRTRFCVHPEGAVEDIPIIGGTKNPRIDKIVDAEPDLIIANKEENRPEDIRQLRQKTTARIEVTEIATIEDALLAINTLGALLEVSDEAAALAENISEQLEERPETAPLRTAYFIWREPWMTVGGDTYIHDVLERWNLTNIFGHRQRYPTIELEALSERNPELILLSSEPFPFKEKHLAPVQEACPGAQIELVDGQWFSWYGSRMLHAFKQLNKWRRTVG